MGKIFAVAMMLKKTTNNHIEEYLVLHIVTDRETPGDAFLKAFDNEKDNRNQGAGCYAKVVLEIEQGAPPLSTDTTAFAEWAACLHKFHVGGKWEDDDGHYFTTAQLWDKYQKEVKPTGWPHICHVCGKQDCESDHK